MPVMNARLVTAVRVVARGGPGCKVRNLDIEAPCGSGTARRAMHLVVDAVPVERGSSAVVLEHLLRGWREAYPDDRLTVVTGPAGAAFELPPDVPVEILRPPALGPLRGLWMR